MYLSCDLFIFVSMQASLWYCDTAELTASVWWAKGANGFVKRSLGFVDGYLVSNGRCEGGKKESIHPV